MPKKNAVAETHKTYKKNIKKWQRLRHAIEGQDAVHEAGELYLPKLGGQDADEYKAYKLRALWYGATGRTLDGLTGMIFRKAPVVEMPTQLQELSKNITLDGLSLLGFAQEIVDNVIAVGRAGILVDMPNLETVEGEITVAAAEANGIRPFMKHYPAEAIRNWKTATVRNEQVLQEVRLTETVITVDPEDEFGVIEVEQIRVLDLHVLTEGDAIRAYRQRVFRENDKKEWVQEGEDIYPKMAGKVLDFIPFYFAGVKNGSPEIEKPPMIDLADVNFSHYRSTADVEHGAHFTALPTGYVAGVQEDDQGNSQEYRIGSATAWTFPDPATKVGFLEFTGQGLAAVETRIEKKEQQMAALGARMLQAENKGVEAAETAQIHRQGENSVLSSISVSVSETIEQALKTVLLWLGSNEEITFQLNKDFLAVVMSPQQLTALIGAWQAGAIAFDDLLTNLKRGEVVALKDFFSIVRFTIGIGVVVGGKSQIDVIAVDIIKTGFRGDAPIFDADSCEGCTSKVCSVELSFGQFSVCEVCVFETGVT